MIRVPQSEAKQGGRLINGQIITQWQKYRNVFHTTAQREQGYATADTFVYMLTGETYKNGDLKAQKTSCDKGYRGIGG